MLVPRKKKTDLLENNNLAAASPTDRRTLFNRTGKPKNFNQRVNDDNDDDDDEEQRQSDESTENYDNDSNEEDENEEEEEEIKRKSPTKKRKIIERKNYIGNSNLTKAEKNILKSFFRKEFFKKLKFVNDSVIGFNSAEMIDCFNKINLVSDDEKSKKHSSIARLMNSCVMSKRNYVIDRIKKQMKSKCLKYLFCLLLIYFVGSSDLYSYTLFKHFFFRFNSGGRM